MRITALAFALLFAFIGMLWPFGTLPLCSSCLNHVRAYQGRIDFPGHGILESTASDNALAVRLIASRSFTLEAWLTPSRTRQSGPARILSYSDGPFRRNFTLGQEGRDLILRLRTTETDLNGMDRQVAFENVFVAGERRHVVVSFSHHAASLYLDGLLTARVEGPDGSFDNWTGDYPLVLGNETTGNRPWLGRMEKPAIYDRALTAAEVLDRYTMPDRALNPAPLFSVARSLRLETAPFRLESEPIGIDLEAPARYLNAGAPRPFAENSPQPSGFVTAMLLLLPLGFTLARTVPGHRPAAMLIAFGAAALLAIGFEALQAAVAARSSAPIDLAGAVLGGGLGALLGSRRTLPFFATGSVWGHRISRSAVLVSIAFGATFCAVAIEAVWLGQFAAPPPTAGVIIVLGSGTGPHGKLSRESRNRAETGIALFEAGIAPRIHFTGAGQQGAPSVGAQMRELALEMGVPPEAATAETQSESTLQNALMSRDMIGAAADGPVVLVSDGFHLTRARFSFRWAGYGPPVSVSATSVFGESPPVGWPLVIGREALAWWFNLGRVLAWQAFGWLGVSETARLPYLAQACPGAVAHELV